ncbi:MAG: dihydroorotate dehydrogenase [Bacteroidales bacterium]|jgi:dihydroorotate dehydrogenase (NAD+) catalytic subunit|nr:dihydroorotate dehydrogenase [Bacteroidales bacterium]
MVNLEVNIGKLQLKNPILTASGTFGYGYEFEDFFDISQLGGIIVKATTAEHREGNSYPRMAETSHGMLNAVGLQNKGINYFVENIYPKLKKINTNIIANVSGSTIESCVEVAERMNELDHITAIELNISCPNVKEGGMAFGTSTCDSYNITSAVRKVYQKQLIVKLSPNVTNIAEIAKSVESAGADSVSLVNTFLAMAIDIKTRKPILSTITGGLSGPAIKPIALRMVWQVYKAIKIPIIGLGGIMNSDDAVEFFLAGASAIQVGTANFINPSVTIDILNGLKEYCEKQGVNDIRELIGGMK